jgi:hypothetical protein
MDIQLFTVLVLYLKPQVTRHLYENKTSEKETVIDFISALLCPSAGACIIYL